jgi:hypothetical protein
MSLRELRMSGSALLGVALCVWVAALPLAASAAPYERPGSLSTAGVASDAHRSDRSGAYGGLKSRRAPLRGAGDVRDNDNKQPYYYRYYNDTDRSPASCRRYASRAIATKNRNWWTRYRACLN